LATKEGFAAMQRIKGVAAVMFTQRLVSLASGDFT
jgi:hypothetical protein